MNVTTQEQQQQSPLHAHYDRANQAFQTGDYAQALKELTAARQHAQSDDQRTHIDKSIRTVQEMIQDQNDVEETPEYTEEKRSEGSNKLLLLTVLVGLICLTPIIMKMIEIFSQPSVQNTESQAVASAPAVAGAEGAETATSTEQGQPAANSEAPQPASTPNLIVNPEGNPVAAVAAPTGTSYTIAANMVNLRAEASTQAAAITRLTLNQNVAVIEHESKQADGYTWSKIETTAGDTGWIASKFLVAAASPSSSVANTNTLVNSADVPATDTATSNTTVNTTENTKTVNGSGVSVRSTPSTTGQRLISLTQAQVTVLADAPVEADGFSWTKIRTDNGTVGWIASKFLQ